MNITEDNLWTRARVYGQHLSLDTNCLKTMRAYENRATVGVQSPSLQHEAK